MSVRGRGNVFMGCAQTCDSNMNRNNNLNWELVHGLEKERERETERWNVWQSFSLLLSNSVIIQLQIENVVVVVDSNRSSHTASTNQVITHMYFVSSSFCIYCSNYTHIFSTNIYINGNRLFDKANDIVVVVATHWTQTKPWPLNRSLIHTCVNVLKSRIRLCVCRCGCCCVRHPVNLTI